MKEYLANSWSMRGRRGFRTLAYTGLMVAMASCTTPESNEESAPPTLGQPSGEGGKGDVFGSDDRLDVYSLEESSTLRAATKAVAAMVPRSRLNFDAEIITLAEPPETLQIDKYLCDDAKFASQPVIASCTGFLVAPDILITAGHCVKQGSTSIEALCAESTWIFDLAYEDEAAATAGDIPTFDPENVFGCAEVLAYESQECTADYAVVRLDREVVGRTPLTIQPTRPELGELVSAIGFPSGIPMKVAPGTVADMSYYTSVDSFEATVDGFGGNSGGPIVDPDGSVRGILVCGNSLPEYVSGANGCWRTSQCDTDGTCRGMGVYAMDNLSAYLECHATQTDTDCAEFLPSYPECDPHAPVCEPGKTCQFAPRISKFRCLASTENVTEVGQNCYLDACPSGALCVKKSGMNARSTDVQCHTLCQSDECGRRESCGPIEWRYDQARVCYPR